jgi:hypothetical protein
MIEMNALPGEASQFVRYARRIEELPKQFHSYAFVQMSKLDLGVSPRPLLIGLRSVCQELVLPPKEGGLIDVKSEMFRLHQHIDGAVIELTNCFDTMQTIENGSRRQKYMWFVEALILMYTAFYPWCVTHESAWMLTATTLGMCFIFHGLREITQRMEDARVSPEGFLQTFEGVTNIHPREQQHANWGGDPPVTNGPCARRPTAFNEEWPPEIAPPCIYFSDAGL